MLTIFLIIYILFCLLVASAAKNVTIGFWGVLIMSIFLTPLLTAILVLILRPQPKEKKKREFDDLDLELEEDY